jgi:hypothetical protein
MQLAPPTNAPIGTITLGAWNPHGGYMVRHTVDLLVDAASPAPTLRDGATIAEALAIGAQAAAASTSPAGTPVGRAYALLQAADGALQLAPLPMHLQGGSYPAAIDGPTLARLGATEVSATRRDASLLALVGSSSWIDLSLQSRGTPQRLGTS